MKYVILIMNTDAARGLSESDGDAWMKEVMAWYDKWGTSGQLVDGGQELQPPHTAKTIRSAGVTDGPFMEAKEIVGGYSILETDTIDEAVEIARTWPGVDRGLITIEVRPVVER